MRVCDLPPDMARSPEFFEDLLTSDKPVRVERIVSWGHVTPEGEYYDQDWDEWVMVVQGAARLGFADGREKELVSGEAFFLPAHLKHRVLFTSKPCIWLAVHGGSLHPLRAD